MKRYLGKRFAAFSLCVSALVIGLMYGPIEAFPSYSTTLGLLFAAYIGGQSATDWKHGSVPGG